MESTTHQTARSRSSLAHLNRGARLAIAALRIVIAGAGLSALACVPEGDEACGEHQVYESGGTVLLYAVCVCDSAAGYVFDQQQGYGCKRCDEGQSIVNGKCTSPGAETDASTPPDGSSSMPTGLGEPCSSEADCAGFDAKFCAPQTRACMINSCADGTNACPTTTVCCDFSALLAGFSLCVADDQLANGNCPMGGEKVEP